MSWLGGCGEGGYGGATLGGATLGGAIRVGTGDGRSIRIGTKKEVFKGKADITSTGQTAADFTTNDKGKVVSKARYEAAMRNFAKMDDNHPFKKCARAVKACASTTPSVYKMEQFRRQLAAARQRARIIQQKAEAYEAKFARAGVPMEMVPGDGPPPQRRARRDQPAAEPPADQPGAVVGTGLGARYFY